MGVRALTAEERERLDHIFRHHPPTGDAAERHSAVRAACRDLGQTLLEQCPESNELRCAMHKLREAMMWANAAIALEQPRF